MASCDITPEIINRAGQPVDSQLWKDLSKIYNNRDWVKKIYEGIHTDHFISWFGDWINNADDSSLVVDENGEPKIANYVEYLDGEVVPVFLNVRDETTYAELNETNGVIEVGEDFSSDSMMVIYDDDGGQVDITKQVLVHSDPRIQAAYDEWGLLITSTNNPLVWDVQDKLGLINKDNPWATDRNGIKFRRKQGFSFAKAKKLAKEATDMGYPSTTKEVQATYGRRSKHIVIVSKDISQRTTGRNNLVERFSLMKKDRAELEERFDLLWKAQSKMSDLEKLHAKVTEAFEARISIMEKQYNFIKRQDFEEFLDDYLEQNNISDALVKAVEYSGKITQQLFNKYADMKKNNEPLTAKVLATWSDFLVAYDVLDELQDLILSDQSIIQNEEVRVTLDDSIKKKNFLKKLYFTEGIPLMAKWLAPHYNGIYKKFEDKIRAEYRKEFHRKKNKRKYDEDVVRKDETRQEYVDRLMKKNEGKLRQQTEDLLEAELVKASRDISELSRWIDNMLDTSDPVAAAVVNAFVKADEQSRAATIRKRTEAVSKVAAYERFRKKGNFESSITFYKKFLEFDENGAATQHLLRPWVSDLIEEERRQYKRIYKQGEVDDVAVIEHEKELLASGRKTKEKSRADKQKRMSDSIANWRKHHIRIYEEERDAALSDYMKSLVDKIDPLTGEVILTHAEWAEIENSVFISGLSPRTLAKEGKISDEAVELFLTWRAKNTWKYSNVRDQWKNPQWDVFMKEVNIPTDIPYYQQEEMLRASKDPNAEFYMYILDMADEADNMVPLAYRLGGRLPGVAKNQSERIKESQDASIIMKQTMNANIKLRPEDIERGEMTLTDEQGNPIMFLPIHYSNKIELVNQSFDLPGIYFRYWESANDYNIKRQILPEIEMAKTFIENRKATKRNSLDQIVMSKLTIRGKGNIDEEDNTRTVPAEKDKTALAKQFADWFEMAVYGKKSLPGTLWHVKEDVVLDVSKMVDSLNRYTSISLLAFNVVQAGANAILAETIQAIDAFAHEHVSIKSLTKATGKYSKWLPAMVGDWGARAPHHVGSLLIEWANVLHTDVTDVNFSKKTKVGQLLELSTTFALQKAGEHWAQGRFLYAMLEEKRAYNEAGEDIGSMLDNYYAEDGVLKIKDNVSLVKSKWTQKDQEVFMIKARGLLSRMHGEYSDLGRVAIQRMAVGKLAYMFRKFVVPGWRRRYGRMTYIQRIDQNVEGNYITMFKFLNELRKDLKIFQMALMSEEWAALSDHEKANVRRALGEVVSVISVTILAGALYKGLEGDDEDDRLLAYWAYQAYRLQTELLFFSPKIDEAMTILRSPAAAMSVAENAIRLIGQMGNPGKRYERGPWKGELKIKKTAINFVPLYKQYYKMRDVEGTIAFFKN